MPEITVAICTARESKDTHYEKWMSIRRAFLNRKIKSKHLNGEFGALLASVLDEQLDYHIEYQVRALEKGTRRPDRIIIVDRVKEMSTGMEYWGEDGDAVIIRPMMSLKELEVTPGSALAPSLDYRSNKVSMGCNDKNTAIALCETEFILMLDDCCLPGFGLVEAAYQACESNNVLLVGHQQMYVESDKNSKDWENSRFEVSQANWLEKKTVLSVNEAKQLRRVFGVWAMQLSHILAVNGFNTALDGDRAGLDVELMERMDRYMQASDVKYEINPAARIYEIGHSHPWVPWRKKEATKEDKDDGIELVHDDRWRELLPEGWGFKSPGPNLKEIRKDAGVVVGGDIFSLSEHVQRREREEVIGDILDEFSEDEDD